MSSSMSKYDGVFKMPTYACIDGLFMPLSTKDSAKRPRLQAKRIFDNTGYVLEGEQCDAFDQTVLFSLVAQILSMSKGDKKISLLEEDKDNEGLGFLGALYDKMGGLSSVYYKTTMYKIAKDCFGAVKPNNLHYKRIHDSLNRLSGINVRVKRKEGRIVVRSAYSLIFYTSVEDVETGKIEVYISFSDFFSRVIAGYVKQFTLIDFFERSKLSPVAQLVYSFLCYVVRPKGKLNNWSVDSLVKHIYNIADVSAIDRKILYKYRKKIFDSLIEIKENTGWHISVDDDKKFFSLRRPAINSGDIEAEALA